MSCLCPLRSASQQSHIPSPRTSPSPPSPLQAAAQLLHQLLRTPKAVDPLGKERMADLAIAVASVVVHEVALHSRGLDAEAQKVQQAAADTLKVRSRAGRGRWDGAAGACCRSVWQGMWVLAPAAAAAGAAAAVCGRGCGCWRLLLPPLLLLLLVLLLPGASILLRCVLRCCLP